MDHVQQFFYMQGYGYFIWPAYTAVFLILLIQWYVPWRRWKKHQQKLKNTCNHHELSP